MLCTRNGDDGLGKCKVSERCCYLACHGEVRAKKKGLKAGRSRRRMSRCTVFDTSRWRWDKYDTARADLCVKSLGQVAKANLITRFLLHYPRIFSKERLPFTLPVTKAEHHAIQECFIASMHQHKQSRQLFVSRF